MARSSLRKRLSVLGALALSACSANREREESPVPAPLPAGEEARLDENRFFAAPVTMDRLTIWPVIDESPIDIGEFVTLQDAQAKGTAQVREVSGAGGQNGAPSVQTLVNDFSRNGAQVDTPAGADNTPAPRLSPAPRPSRPPASRTSSSSAGWQNGNRNLSQVASAGGGATVGTVVVENLGDVPILICAGTIIKGGKQDRQIGEDLVVAPKSTAPVKAFCVEQGRWNANRSGSNTRGRFSAQNILANKMVRQSGQYEANQSIVWKNVELANQSSGERPSTGTLLAAIDGDGVASSGKSREELSKNIQDRFSTLSRADGGAPVGFAYAIDGKLMAVKTFAHPRLLEAHLESLANTMAFEATLGGNQSKETPKPVTTADVVDFVERLNELSEKVHATAGMNDNGFRESELGWNGNCYAEVLMPAGDGTNRPGRVALTQDWTVK